MMELAVAAATKCPYCQVFHKGAVKLQGATEEELAEVGVLAGLTARWSAMIHAQHYDYVPLRTRFTRSGPSSRNRRKTRGGTKYPTVVVSFT